MHQITTTTAITIAIVKRRIDWQRIIDVRQYHMPVRHIARVMQSPWVGLYVPGWHTTRPHRISYVATITAMAITPRRVYLPHESTHPRADQLYAILTFDAIYALRAPIWSTHWRRISIHHTTWGVLARAYDLGALRPITRQMPTHTHIDDDNLFDLFAIDDGHTHGATIIE